jgi:streptogramin lyase
LNDAASPTTADSCPALAANGGVNNPSQGNCVLTYDGGDLASISLTATTNSSLVGAAQITNATLSLTRTANGGVGVPGAPAIAQDPVTAGLQPSAVGLGPDHRVWFGDLASSTIGAMTTGGTLTTYPVAGSPGHIVAGPDGEVWFTERGALGVDVLNVDGTSRARFTNLAFGATALTVGPDNKMWVTEGRDIAQFGWDTNGAPTLLHEYALTAGSESYEDVTSGPNGHLWTVEDGVSGADAIVEVDPGTGNVVNTFAMPTVTDATYGLVTGTDGNLWFGDYTAKSAVVMTPAGVYTSHALTGRPTSVTNGPDGAVWLTEEFPDMIARVDTITGAVHEYSPLPTVSTPPPSMNPLGIVTGADNNLWFSESTGTALGVLTP